MSIQESLPFDRLHPKQRKALLSLLRGSTTEQAANDADVSARTIRRWRKLPDFDAALRAARIDFFSACRSQVVAAQAEAFQALKNVAGCSWSTPDRVRSSAFLIEYTSRPEMAEHLGRQEAKSHEYNNLVQFTPDKRGQTQQNPTKTPPSQPNLTPFFDDAG